MMGLSASLVGYLALAASLVAGAGASRPAAGVDHTLTVFAAASLTDAFKEVGRRFERHHPGSTVRFNFAGSQQLTLQLQQGASADVFASADTRWMAAVSDSGLVAGEAQVFAHNLLVVIVPVSNPARIDRLQDLARRGTKVVLAADAVPAGHYAREALQKLAETQAFRVDYAKRVLENVVSQEENVKSVVAKVQLAEADAGFVYHSDVTPAVARALRVLEIPEGANVRANYPIGVLREAPEAELARGFVDLVMSPEGQAVLEQYGFIPVAVGTGAPSVAP